VQVLSWTAPVHEQTTMSLRLATVTFKKRISKVSYLLQPLKEVASVRHKHYQQYITNPNPEEA
jgi:hypothetical protein